MSNRLTRVGVGFEIGPLISNDGAVLWSADANTCSSDFANDCTFTPSDDRRDASFMMLGGRLMRWRPECVSLGVVRTKCHRNK